MNPEKYFLAIIPPPPVSDYVNKYRRQYNNKDNINSIPPHITIYPPFYSLVSESNLIDRLRNIQTQTSPFRISFTSVDFFNNGNNVAFFNPDSDSTLFLKKLYQNTRQLFSGQITDVWPGYPNKPEQFIPHCTIAEKIPDIEFPSIRKDLESLSVNQSFNVKSIFLLRKQVKTWLTVSEINFN